MAFSLANLNVFVPGETVGAITNGFLVLLNAGVDEANPNYGKVAIVDLSDGSSREFLMTAPSSSHKFRSTGGAVAVGNYVWCAYSASASVDSHTTFVRIEPSTETATYYAGSGHWSQMSIAPMVASDGNGLLRAFSTNRSGASNPVVHPAINPTTGVISGGTHVYNTVMGNPATAGGVMYMPGVYYGSWSLRWFSFEPVGRSWSEPSGIAGAAGQAVTVGAKTYYTNGAVYVFDHATTTLAALGGSGMTGRGLAYKDGVLYTHTGSQITAYAIDGGSSASVAPSPVASSGSMAYTLPSGKVWFPVPER